MFRSGSARLRRLGSDSRGAAAIEFAIAFGLVVVLLLAAVEVGAVLMARSEIARALGRVVRVVQLRPETAALEVAARLSAELGDDIAWSVRARPIEGTDYLALAVSAPYQLSIPFLDLDPIMIKAEAMAPILPAR